MQHKNNYHNGIAQSSSPMRRIERYHPPMSIFLFAFLLLCALPTIAIRSYEEVDISTNVTIHINNNAMSLSVNDELVLTQGLYNLTNFTYQEEIFQTRMIDNRIFLQTTACNTSLIASEVKSITADNDQNVKEYINTLQAQLDKKLEPLTSLQGRLDTKQREYNELHNKFTQKESELKLCETEKTNIQEDAKSDRIMRNIFFWYSLIATLGIVIVFLKSIGKLLWFD